MLINLTNHPFDKWDKTQKQAASQFGTCIDLPFPSINPIRDEIYIYSLAEDYLQRILQIKIESKEEITVHLMGELTFVFALLEKLKYYNITCVASTTKRISKDLGNGQKETIFNFVRFRNYFF